MTTIIEKLTRIFEQTKHFTLVALFPNVICSFLHFGHLIFMNLLDGSFNILIPPSTPMC